MGYCFTYSYRKSTIPISLLNAVILLVAVGAIVIESIHKFSEPTEVNGIAVSWTAGVGILINEHVNDTHHIHVWAISTTETALTAHVVVDDLTCWPGVSERLKHALSSARALWRNCPA